MITRKKNIIRMILLVWIILWVNFTLRDLFHKGDFYDYKTMMCRDEDGRRSYVYGDDFYRFLKFSKDKISSPATYAFLGVEQLSLDHRRAVYYLYPLLEAGDAEYLLVYNNPGYQNTQYRRFAELDNNRFILRKIGRHKSAALES